MKTVLPWTKERVSFAYILTTKTKPFSVDIASEVWNIHYTYKNKKFTTVQ